MDPAAAIPPIDGLTPELISLLFESRDAFVATKYFAGAAVRFLSLILLLTSGPLDAAAGLVCVMYDHMLTMDTEVSVIWRAECPMVTRLVYLMNRYVMEGMLIIVAYGE